MTKKQFNKLRKEMCIRIYRLNPERNKEISPNFWKVIDRMPVPRWNENMRSYAEAWEQLKPARDVVGM